MKISDAATNLAASLKAIVKVILKSRRPALSAVPCDRPLIVMGNGPSLKAVLADGRQHLADSDLLAVNFAANAPEFSEIRPQYYVLADPLFFSEVKAQNMQTLRDSLERVDWPMTLIVPADSLKRARVLYGANTNIKLQTINAVGVEGFGWLRHALYNARLAMPRPRNVLIPSLMAGIWLGYKEIYVVGADHSWMQTISVDEDNRVVSVQPHFYKEDDSEKKRVACEYAGYHLHDIVLSFYVAFRAYHYIADYARIRKVQIYNATHGSFIDAFVRRPLP